MPKYFLYRLDNDSKGETKHRTEEKKKSTMNSHLTNIKMAEKDIMNPIQPSTSLNIWVLWWTSLTMAVVMLLNVLEKSTSRLKRCSNAMSTLSSSSMLSTAIAKPVEWVKAIYMSWLRFRCNRSDTWRAKREWNLEPTSPRLQRVTKMFWKSNSFALPS